ncbi:MAG: hypothetical protein CL815_06655 [Coraliomargarita sp.]|nr:hypothetical protein [Coraliomargarita sp.]|tara:strand:+ start:2470 stop:3273 length:804 start_codon:yes stop_codon:yes gene_type:complete
MISFPSEPNFSETSLQAIQNDPRLGGNPEEIKDPDKVFADVTKRQADRYERDFKPYETSLVERTQADTSLIDAVPQDVAQQQGIAEDISRRNRERFGFESTAALSEERQRALQRGGAINLAGGLNEARLSQLNQNQKVLSDLINIGQGLNRSSLSGLGAAAENSVARRNQYERDRVAYKNARTSMLASIASAPLAFFSDIRLKKDITFSHKEGNYNVYTWEWNKEAVELGAGDLPKYGVLAQEIKVQKPEAVMIHDSGYLMVDYGKL